MGFSDALGILGGSQPAALPSTVSNEASPNGVPRIMITPSSNRESGGFGRALDILSSSEVIQPKQEQKSVGGLESFGRGVASGFTGNFYDELRGLSEAGGAKEKEPMSLGAILVGAAKRIMGDEGAESQYEKTVQRERGLTQAATEQHPIASLAGNVAGAVALPVGGALSAPTLGGRMARGAALGAGYGAVYGAGEGTDVADRLNKAGAGVLFGAAGGAAAPAVMSGVGAASRGVAAGVGKVLGNPVQTMRAALNPEEEAARRIGKGIIADYATGAPGMSGADLVAARSAGQPTAIIDIGGENTRALARSAANTSPTARAALEDMATDRFATQSDRVSNFVRNLVPTGGNATRTQEAIDFAERVANKPGYARAYAAGDKSINSPELERLMGSPDVVAAMRDAAQKGKSRAIAEGFGAFNPGVRITDDGQVIFSKGKNGVPAYPNLQFWDYTYRSLRDAGQAAYRAGRNDEGSYLSNIAKQMRSELDAIVPEYGKARGVAAQFFQAENALEAGQKFVSMRGPIAEARAAHAKMTPAQKALFAEGYVSDLADKVSKIADNRSVVIDRIFNSPDGRARTELALGKGRSAELEAFLRRENMMDLARKAMGNSTTARQLMEMGLAGGIGAAAGGATEAALNGKIPDLKTAMAAALVGGAAGFGRKVNFKVAQRVGEMLASDDPKVLMTAIKMAKTNPDMGRAIQRAETMLEKMVGQQANAGSPLLPRIPAGRSEEQNQQ